MTTSIDRLLSLRVGDVMRGEVVSIRMHQSMSDAAAVLAKHEISGAPVVDEQGRCVGMLSARDFVGREQATKAPATGFAACDKAVVRESPGGPWVITDVFGDQVAAYMAHAVQTVTADTRLVDAGRIMCAQHVHRLPVLDEGGHPLGMITSLDIVASMVQAADEVLQNAVGPKRTRGASQQKNPTALASELDRQHAGLRSQFDTLRKALAEERNAARLVETMEEFARQADRHFRHEEGNNGFLQAITHAPRLVERAQALLTQHAGLREHVRELVDLARGGISHATITKRLDALAQLWLQHETEENDLLLEAYTQDIGAKD